MYIDIDVDIYIYMYIYIHMCMTSESASEVAVRYLAAIHEVQVSAEEAPCAAEYLPPSHLLHELGPGTDLYLPATQAVQAALPPAPVAPGSQLQAVAAVLAMT